MKTYDLTYRLLEGDAEPTEADFERCAEISAIMLRRRFPGCVVVEAERGVTSEPPEHANRRAAYVRMEVMQ